MYPSWARLCVILQAWLAITLAPLAYATPVDPLWIPGIYDEADQDDVIGLLTDDGLALANVSSTGGDPFATKPRSLNSPAHPFILASTQYTPHLRSPPSC